ncbi:hypothetical protein SASPL_143183 [Salvia splendens]|uniref:DUF4005 domain-containing protein n=1 Tax=Salvia splendens TaxID=180675 RepID=A0A8X8ZA50_SALSN|nr:hypothetical protein SASPL_143183 [Salvia splendens]
MGRASKWFRGLLTFNKPDPTATPPSKKRWTFPKGKHRRRSHHHAVVPGSYVDDDETSRRVIALATATAAVAEAAVAAAHAAAAVAQLTSGGGFDRATAAHAAQNGVAYACPEERAAVVIQSHFRAYLSRRALRALRALVKLQAVVRGHILRKRNVDKLRQLQALVRAQARALAGRLLIEESTKPSQLNHTEKADHATLAGVKMQRRKGDKAAWDQGDKFRPYHVVEYIPAFPHIRPRRQSNGSSKRALFTPAKSSLSSCTEEPSYVAYKVIRTLRHAAKVMTPTAFVIRVFTFEQHHQSHCKSTELERINSKDQYDTAKYMSWQIKHKM